MLPCDIVLTTCKVGVKMIVSNLCAAKYFGKESIISVTPVIWTAMIDITIVICANLIVIMMAFTSECVESLLPFQTISQKDSRTQKQKDPLHQACIGETKHCRATLNFYQQG